MPGGRAGRRRHTVCSARKFHCWLLGVSVCVVMHGSRVLFMCVATSRRCPAGSASTACATASSFICECISCARSRGRAMQSATVHAQQVAVATMHLVQRAACSQVPRHVAMKICTHHKPGLAIRTARAGQLPHVHPAQRASQISSVQETAKLEIR